MKVLCVGDSITVGVGDGYVNGEGGNNGYRLDLYNLMSAAKLNAQFIGTQVSGTYHPQPRHEGYGWQTIYSILSKLQINNILAEQPDLVLIHAGTNDDDSTDKQQESNDPQYLFSREPARLGELIDHILCHTPEAVVLVAEVVQNKYNQTSTNIFNAAIPGIVGQRYMQGYKVRVVDLSMIGGIELSDMLHPTAAGYSDMANRWWSSIQGVPNYWWSKSAHIKVRNAGEISITDSSKAPSSTGACSFAPLSTKATPELAPVIPTKVSTNSAGQTIIDGTYSIQMTFPLGIVSATTITQSNQHVVTYVTGGNLDATTVVNSLGQTAPFGQQMTLPTAVTTVLTMMASDGEVMTYGPSRDATITAEKSASQTGISAGGLQNSSRKIFKLSHDLFGLQQLLVVFLMVHWS